ncbi:MAG: hypothetical protein HYX38_32655 [Rhodospirillales bacterium]|nr:hypothetical protein [Rhodospirillales bacterium]
MKASWKSICLAMAMGLSFTSVPIIQNPAAADNPYQNAYQTGYNTGYTYGYRNGYFDGSLGRSYHNHPPHGHDPYTSGVHDGTHRGYDDGYRDARNGVESRY